MNKIMQGIIQIGLVVLLVATAVVAGKSFFRIEILNDAQWVCIAKTCTEYATGQEWVNRNCKAEGVNNTMVCNVTIENKIYKAPLSIINMSSAKSCKAYGCVTEVFIRGAIPETITS